MLKQTFLNLYTESTENLPTLKKVDKETILTSIYFHLGTMGSKSKNLYIELKNKDLVKNRPG